MMNDLRHACRSILRAPALSAVIVLSLGAGVGVNTVVFSWIQARILNPIPGVSDGAGVRLIEPKSEAGLYTGASWPEFREMRETLGSFEQLFAARMVAFYIGEPGNVERVFGMVTSDNYFAALGVGPAIGRFFGPQDVMAPAAEPPVVISHRIWSSRFGRSDDVLRRTVRINGAELQVIGVTPPEFQGTTAGLQVDAWLPAPLARGAARDLQDRSSRGYSVMGRLRQGASAEQAQAELDGLMRRFTQTYRDTNRGVTAEVLPFHMSPRGPQRMLNVALTVLQAIMLLLLLAVCGNVANLMLARATSRRTEIGIRLALGAHPARIVSLLLGEAVLLALAGSALGVVIAIWGTRALLILPMVGLPVRFQTSIDAGALAFALTLGMLAGIASGIAPALHLARGSLLTPHVSGITSVGGRRLRDTLMGAQVALAMVVLIVAGLFFEAVVETRTTDPGFRRDGILLAAYDLSGRQVSSEFARDLALRALSRIQAIPIVESAAIAASVPLDIHGLPSRTFSVDGRARPDGGSDEALINTVTPGYFAVMDIPVIAGRDFTSLVDSAPVREAVVNEEFVTRYVTGGEPMGRRIVARGGPFTIVGVVRNSIYDAFGEPPAPAIYFSYRDVPQPRGEIHVRIRNGATGAAAEIGRAMREVDAELPVFNLRTLRQHIETNLIFRTIPARMFSVLGPMLLALAAIGIYAVVSYSVSMRTREIALRLAIGATAQRVVGELVRESVGAAAVGAFAGWGLAFMLARALAPRGAVEPVVFAIVPLVMLTAATLACWLPARRAASVDPAITLRGE